MFLKKIGWTIKYITSTIKHKWFVVIAGRKLPKKYRVSWYRLLLHDWSKFTLSEAPHYGRHFFGDKGNAEAFYRAWLHHANCNAHHWQYWILETDKILPMPKKFVHEMVADWMGAERSYNNSWDMSNWLLDNLLKIQIHENTREYLYEVLSNSGYEQIVKRIIVKKRLEEI